MPLRPSSKFHATKREPEGGGKPSHEDFHREWLPQAFVRSASKQRTLREPDDNETERSPMAYLPYVADVSERIRKVCRDFNIRTVFKSGPTLCVILAKVKYPLPTTKQSNVVYEVPCTCGKVYIEKRSARPV